MNHLTDRQCVLVATGLILTLTVVRIVYLWIVPLDLIADEAYYWDWSRHVDIGYYSKPPMIAWVNYVSRSLLWHDAFCVRLPAPLFNAAAMGLLYLLGQAMFSHRVALWALVLLAASPGAVALNLVMTIDAPLVLFWTLGLLAAWKALQAEGVAWRWWFLAGIAGGLGLLTKQMMLAYLGGLFLLMGMVPEWRRHLRTPAPYLMLVVALIVFSPVVYWNYQNGWITLEHTGHHFHANRKPWYHGLSTCFEYVGGQIGVVSPITAVLALAVCWQVFRRLRPKREPRELFLFLLGPLGLVGIAFLSFRQRINANWPAVFHIGTILLLAAWAGGALQLGPRVDRWRKALVPAVGLGLVMALGLYALPFAYNLAGLDGGAADPAKRLRGWASLGAELSNVVEELPRPDDTVIVAFNRKHTAELAYYMRSQPRTYEWRANPDSIRNQYTIWGGPVDRIGADALLVLPRDKEPPDEIRPHFRAIRKLVELRVPNGSDGFHHVTLYHGQEILSWPQRTK